jgi:hypothetical protein
VALKSENAILWAHHQRDQLLAQTGFALYGPA